MFPEGDACTPSSAWLPVQKAKKHT